MSTRISFNHKTVTKIDISELISLIRLELVTFVSNTRLRESNLLVLRASVFESEYKLNRIIQSAESFSMT